MKTVRLLARKLDVKQEEIRDEEPDPAAAEHGFFH